LSPPGIKAEITESALIIQGSIEMNRKRENGMSLEVTGIIEGFYRRTSLLGGLAEERATTSLAIAS